MQRDLPVIGAASGGCAPGGAAGRPADRGMTRRELIQLGALSAGAVAFTGCQPPEREMTAQSRVRLAEDLVEGHDAWYATACRGCEAGCGAIIRVAAGRAKKLEGNPDHPVNLGRSCARAQAVVQEQYHPDRLTGPLLRSGPRGSGAYLPISWDDALTRVAEPLRLLQDQGRAEDVAFLTATEGGVSARLLADFAQAYGGRWLRLDPLAPAPVRAAVQRVFGTDRLPTFDIANTRFLLTFGADFLSTWLSPVQYSRQYGVFRQGRYDSGGFAPRAGATPRGYMVHVEPRFSMTAASADEWVWVRPGYEGMLALGLAQVILAEGLGNSAGAPLFGDRAGLDAFRPERVADATGVPAERIRRLARRFATEGPSLAFAGNVAGGQTNGTDNVSAVLALNHLVGNVGQPGGVYLPPEPVTPGMSATVSATGIPEWQTFVERLQSGRVPLVLIKDANPAYGLPAALSFQDALGQAPLVVSLSSFLDETTALADLILPAHLPLEDWGASVPDPAPRQAVLTLQQPVVRPLHNTRSSGDVVLQLADRLGGQVREALPWPTFKEMVHQIARDVAGQMSLEPAGAAAADGPFWTGLLQRGGVWETAVPRARPAADAGQPDPAPPTSTSGAQGGWQPASWRAPAFDGDPAAFPFHLVPFTHHTLQDGRLAHLPWLQGTPDPVTTVTWQSWVEVHPRVAGQYGLRQGDVAAVETALGRIELPVYISPAAPPDVLAIPMGGGHTGFGRWAGGRGANPLTILAPLSDTETGALAYAATRARLIPTLRSGSLPRLEGTAPARQLEDEPVLRITREA
ncbi:MAG: molybdopterin-dependent oxidoreductase [Chloroflexota bacterium]